MDAELPGVKAVVRASARIICVLGLVLGVLMWPDAASAVTFDQQAERLQLINSYLLDFRPAQGPVLSRDNGIEVGFDLIPVPSIDSRVGAKDEPVEPPEIIPRPRARYHSESGMVLGLSYIPPVELDGYAASLGAVEAGFRFPLGNWRMGLRAYAMDGEVDGPVTDPVISDDFQITNYGGDGLFGLQIGFWLPYLGAGRGKTSSTLTIKSDGVKLKAERSYSYFMAGLTVDMGILRFTLEQSSTDSVLDHFTLSLSLVF